MPTLDGAATRGPPPAVIVSSCASASWTGSVAVDGALPVVPRYGPARRSNWPPAAPSSWGCSTRPRPAGDPYPAARRRPKAHFLNGLLTLQPFQVPGTRAQASRSKRTSRSGAKSGEVRVSEMPEPERCRARSRPRRRPRRGPRRTADRACWDRAGCRAPGARLWCGARGRPAAGPRRRVRTGVRCGRGRFDVRALGWGGCAASLRSTG